jgi:hypothetical protein
MVTDETWVGVLHAQERVDGGDQPGHHVGATVCAARRRRQCPKAPFRRGSPTRQPLGCQCGVAANASAHLVGSARHAESIDGDEPCGTSNG